MGAPLLVFDLDGPLVDSAPDLLATLDVVLPRHGFEIPADPGLRNGIGLGARHLIEYALKQQSVAIDTPTLDAIHRDFLVHYEANICVGTRLYPGTTALLDRFADAGWAFAVCTNKPERMSRLLLRDLGVADRFAAICGGDTFAQRKPHPAHLLDTIAAAASGTLENALMVGDSRTDLDTARAAGVPFVGVTFGYTPVPMAALAPDLLIDSFDRLTREDAEGLIALRGGARERGSRHALI
jgi:phosphoglycolate phosphatase